MKYSSLLYRPEWRKKRHDIIKRDGQRCMVCRKAAKRGYPLHVHHLEYLKGKLPWEYDDSYLITLCADCHKMAHNEHYILGRLSAMNGYSYHFMDRNTKKIISSTDIWKLI